MDRNPDHTAMKMRNTTLDGEGKGSANETGSVMKTNSKGGGMPSQFADLTDGIRGGMDTEAHRISQIKTDEGFGGVEGQLSGGD